MKNLSVAISLALSMEKQGYDHYVATARKTKNPLAKVTLEAIAAKEVDHMKAIEKFATDVHAAIELIRPKTKLDYLKPIMEGLGNSLNANFQGDPDLTQAYRVALGFERDSYNLYDKLSKEAESADVKSFFEFLREEENTHYELLQESLQYLEHPADWFKDEERWNVEGG